MVMGVTRYHTPQGVQPMVSRLRTLCLGLGILSTVMTCAVTPPADAPPAYGPCLPIAKERSLRGVYRYSSSLRHRFVSS
jgi:hypothetical protein